MTRPGDGAVLTPRLGNDHGGHPIRAPSIPTTRFALAPMSGDIRALSGIALLAPLGLVLGAVLARNPVRGTLLGATLFVVVIYAAVWLLGRPTAFELDAAGLGIRWPLRSQRIAAGDIAGADLLSRESFRQDFGWGLRIGAGGLWGGFGWLYTRRGLVDLYVSRTDRFVLVRRRAGRPLLLTPERDESFVDALRALSRG